MAHREAERVQALELLAMHARVGCEDEFCDSRCGGAGPSRPVAPRLCAEVLDRPALPVYVACSPRQRTVVARHLCEIRRATVPAGEPTTGKRSRRCRHALPVNAR
jgi:hypothetical protein